MRRLVQILTLALTSLFLLAVPALAAGEEGPTPPADGFGSGLWDGLMLAGVFGVVMGLVVFIDAYANRDEEAEAHGDDHH